MAEPGFLNSQHNTHTHTVLRYSGATAAGNFAYNIPLVYDRSYKGTMKQWREHE